jgi:hypothetical protein
MPPLGFPSKLLMEFSHVNQLPRNHSICNYNYISKIIKLKKKKNVVGMEAALTPHHSGGFFSNFFYNFIILGHNCNFTGSDCLATN